MSRFTKYWYTTLVLLLLLGCAGAFLGSRDVLYTGNRAADTVAIDRENGEWWASTLLLRKSNGKQWCSAVAFNNEATMTVPVGDGHGTTEVVPVTYLVTARHCSGDMWGGFANEVLYNPDGTVRKEIKHKVLNVFEHPKKDFAVLVVRGHTLFSTPVCVQSLPVQRQDFIIGFRGNSHGDFYKLGKFISPAYAYKGQSGGGVFSPKWGLHTIVSTHVDGVNIYIALKDMKMDHLITW